MLNEELNRLYTWFIANRLSLDANKCNYMIFTSKNRSLINSYFNVRIYNISVPNVISTKFLGVLIDQDLTWKLHINNIISKLASYLGVCYRHSMFVPSEVLRLLYYAFIYPHLT